MSEGKSDDKSLFSPMVFGFLVAAVVAIFALSVLLSTIGTGEQTPFRATSASPSAIGHKGFYALLEKLGLPVAKLRAKDDATMGRGDVLVVVEPERRLIDYRKDKALKRAPNMLLILPKWYGQEDFFNDGWVRSVGLLSLDQPRRIVQLVERSATITRVKAPKWAVNTIGIDPTFEGQVQLVASKVLKPLIGTSDGILLGEHITAAHQRIWVLADPDPIENHGITNPNDARFALALIDKLRGGGGRIVFDEMVHGAVAPDRNPLQLLFKFPFVIVTVQILVALALLLLATVTRFGGAEVLPPPFSLGKTRLIDNIAALMERAGHQAVVLRRYIAVKLAETGRALHAPAGLDERAVAVWLDRTGKARGIDAKATTILERSRVPMGVSSNLLLPGLFAEARNIYCWSKDLLDGSRGRQDNH